MKRVLFLLMLLPGFGAFGQTASDALRYAYIRPAGTARFMGVGGAFTALGADFGALSLNPASVALYRTNEFVLTPSLRFQATDAALPGQPGLRDERSSFNMDNAGIIFHSTPRNSKWATFNMGLGFNRQADFNQSIFYDGEGAGTVTSVYFNDAAPVYNSTGDPNNFDQFGALLAWDANAIYPDNTSGLLTYDFVSNPNVVIDRQQAITTRGGINEMQLSFGGNYAEKLMVGLGVGVPILRYRLESVYQESDPQDSVVFFDNLEQTDFLNTDGVGINVKFGLIYHINQMFRLGASFHSPTWYSLTDEYSRTYAYSYTDGGGSVVGDPQISPNGIFDYKLNTPWRAEVGAAAVIGKSGFVSADVEWVDYSASRYNFDPGSPNPDFSAQERQVNAEIQRNYRSVTNFRFGAEWAIEDFRLRGGVNLLGRPNDNTAPGDKDFDTAFTGGVGVRIEGFYLDLGYRHFISDGTLSAYSGAPVVALDNISNEFLLTLGFKF